MLYEGCTSICLPDGAYLPGSKVYYSSLLDIHPADDTEETRNIPGVVLGT